MPRAQRTSVSGLAKCMGCDSLEELCECDNDLDPREMNSQATMQSQPESSVLDDAFPTNGPANSWISVESAVVNE